MPSRACCLSWAQLARYQASICEYNAQVDKILITGLCLKPPHCPNRPGLLGPSRSLLSPAVLHRHSQLAPGLSVLQPTFCSGWLVSAPCLLVVKYLECHPGPNHSPKPVVGPLRSSDAASPPATPVPVLRPRGLAAVCPLVELCCGSSGIHLPGFCDFQALWLWPTSLQQHVGILGSRPMAAWSLGHLQSCGEYR